MNEHLLEVNFSAPLLQKKPCDNPVNLVSFCTFVMHLSYRIQCFRSPPDRDRHIDFASEASSDNTRTVTLVYSFVVIMSSPDRGRDILFLSRFSVYLQSCTLYNLTV